MSEVGIRDIEVLIPKNLVTHFEMAAFANRTPAELLAETGVREKPVFRVDESLIDAMILASQTVIDRNSIPKDEISAIIVGGLGPWGRSFWSPSAKIHQALGTRRATAFELGNGCNSGNLGLQVGSHFLQNSNAKYALLVFGDTLSRRVNYTDPKQTCLFGFSDAASAVLLEKNCPHLQLLSFSSQTDSRFCNFYSAENDQSLITISGTDQEDEDLSTVYREQYISQIRRVLLDQGHSPQKIDHLFMNQGDFKLTRYLARTLEIPEDRIFRSFETKGHLGSSDIFFGLSTRLKQGLINNGDLVVMASSAVGFTWGASLIKG